MLGFQENGHGAVCRPDPPTCCKFIHMLYLCLGERNPRVWDMSEVYNPMYRQRLIWNQKLIVLIRAARHKNVRNSLGRDIAILPSIAPTAEPTNGY
eukprot:72877-Pyramimonas_sp.AAC.1